MESLWVPFFLCIFAEIKLYFIMKKLLLLLTLAIFTVSVHSQELVRVIPDSVSVDLDLIDTGSYYRVYKDSIYVDRFSKKKKADALSLALKILSPESSIKVTTPDTRPEANLKFYMYANKLASEVNNDSLTLENERLIDELLVSLRINEALTLENNSLSDRLIISNQDSDSLMVLLDDNNLLLIESRQLSDSLSLRVTSLNSELVEGQQLNTSLMTNIEEITVLLATTEQINTNLTTDNEILTTNLTNSNDLNTSLIGDKEHLTTILATSKEININLTAENTQLTSLLTTTEQLNTDLTTLLATSEALNSSLTTENTDLTTNLTTSEALNSSLTTDLATSEALNSGLTTENTDLTTNLTTSEALNSSLTTDLATSEALNSGLTEQNLILSDSIQLLKDGWSPVTAKIFSIRYEGEKVWLLNNPIPELAIGNGCDSIPSLDDPLIKVLPKTIIMKSREDFDFKDVPVILNNVHWTLEKGLFNNGVRISTLDAMVSGLIVMNCPAADQVEIAYRPIVGDVDVIWVNWKDNLDGTYTFDDGIQYSYIVFNFNEILKIGDTYDVVFDITEGTTGRALINIWIYPDYSLGMSYNGGITDNTFYSTGTYTETFTVTDYDRIKIGFRAGNFSGAGSFTLSNIKLIKK